MTTPLSPNELHRVRISSLLARKASLKENLLVVVGSCSDPSTLDVMRGERDRDDSLLPSLSMGTMVLLSVAILYILKLKAMRSENVPTQTNLDVSHHHKIQEINK